MADLTGRAGKPPDASTASGAFAGTVPLQCTYGGPVIEDRLRSQASWHPSHAVARVSGHPSHCHCCSRWVQGQARLGWKWVQGRRTVLLIRSITSHRIALVACLPCLAFAWPILLLINARGVHQQTTWQLRVMSVCTVSRADDERDRDTEIDYRRAGQGRTGQDRTEPRSHCRTPGHLVLVFPSKEGPQHGQE